MSDSSNKNTIHFVGIGGIGVSSLARYFISQGHKVSGSDSSMIPEDFKKMGVEVFTSHSEENISKNIKTLIYSSAISDDNPEVLKAKELKIDIKSYPEALGELTKKYYTIAVSGTHGKSTTTAMISVAMIKAGMDPTVIIGTKLREFNNTNFRKGESKYLVIEADEWKAAFLNYYPKIAIITNIEEDHLDFYKDIDDIISTFKQYTLSNVGSGTLVLNGDDENCLKLKNGFSGELIEYFFDSEEQRKIKLSVPGKHNVYNALAVFHALKKIGVREDLITEGLSSFKGAWRRFDEKELTLNSGGLVKVIHDYAHHPTAVDVTVKAVKEKYPDKKITAVLQPHQYKRTYHLLSLFKKVIKSCSESVDCFLVADIYTAKGRESEEIMSKVNSKMLCEEGGGAIYSGDVEKTGRYLSEVLQEDEVLIIMGAGDIYYNIERYISPEKVYY